MVLAVMAGGFWLTLDRTGSIWKAAAAGALAPLGAAMVVGAVGGVIGSVWEMKAKGELREALVGLLGLAVLIVFVVLAWDADIGSDTPDGHESRCADITDRWNDGAGTFSNGNATDDEVEWAMENDCPNW